MNYRGVKILVYPETSGGKQGWIAIPDIAGKEYFSVSKANAITGVKRSIDAEFAKGYPAIDRANRDFLRRNVAPINQNPLDNTEQFIIGAVAGFIILPGIVAATIFLGALALSPASAP